MKRRRKAKTAWGFKRPDGAVVRLQVPRLSGREDTDLLFARIVDILIEDFNERQASHRSRKDNAPKGIKIIISRLNAPRSVLKSNIYEVLLLVLQHHDEFDIAALIGLDEDHYLDHSELFNKLTSFFLSAGRLKLDHRLVDLIARELWCAYRHYVPPEFLIGFLNQSYSSGIRLCMSEAYLFPEMYDWIVARRSRDLKNYVDDCRGEYPSEIEQRAAKLGKRPDLIDTPLDRL